MIADSQSEDRWAGDGVWAVVPVKDLGHVKQRLSPVLSAGERTALFHAMLIDVLTALRITRGLAGIALVTRDPEARRLAVQFGAEVLVEPENRGQTAAVSFAADLFVSQGVTSMLTLPGDVPLVSSGDIAAVLDAHGPAPAITIAPARDELGSNAVVCSPPDALVFRFGDNSFFPHLQRARACRIEPRIIKRFGLGLDIDTPDDLAVFMATPSDTHAYEYLRSSGIISRLGAARRETQKL